MQLLTFASYECCHYYLKFLAKCRNSKATFIGTGDVSMEVNTKCGIKKAGTRKLTRGGNKKKNKNKNKNKKNKNKNKTRRGELKVRFSIKPIILFLHASCKMSNRLVKRRNNL